MSLRSWSCAFLALYSLASCLAQNPAQDGALRAAGKSLDQKPQCVAFQWEPTSKGSAKGAITIPVIIEGMPLRFQFDTGANTGVIYGNVADSAGWSKSVDKEFRPTTLQIAGSVIHRPTITIIRDMKDDKVSGTIGLDSLVGRITVIDYPGRRLCLFDDGGTPREFLTGEAISGSLRHGKLFLPLQGDRFKTDSMVFDTGSSELPIAVDLANWKILTGLVEPETAPLKYEGSAWGKPIRFFGAPSASALRVGNISLSKPIVFLNDSAPHGFSDWPFRADGVLGNAPFWDGIVVLDLTDRVLFRYIK